MREGQKYNTTVSLHINMFDAYEDSPLWETYVKNDIIAKDKDGKVIFGEVHGGQRSSQISYTQEWKLGYAQQRINGLINMIPELTQSMTIHIDAFHTKRPMGQNEPISPLLAYTMQEEAATQRKIFRYWRNLGFDVTSEGAGFLRPDAFVGLQPFAWANEGVVQSKPNKLYCSTPMRAEPEIMNDPVNLTNLLEQFCLQVVPWYYANNSTAVKGTQKMRQGDNLCMPLLWKKERALVAYSKHGLKNKQWKLPPDWKGVTKVAILKITVNGTEPKGKAQIIDEKLKLSVTKGQALLITPNP